MSVPRPVIGVSELETEHKLSAEQLAGRSFDFIVVGAGSAGCVMASKLSAPGASVLLLEAGIEAQNSELSSAPPLAFGLWQSQADWGYVYEPQKELVSDERPEGRRLFIERGKTLGGSSAINYMVSGVKCAMRF